jgi:hypothetical protein
LGIPYPGVARFARKYKEPEAFLPCGKHADARGLRHFESAFKHKAMQFSVLEFEYLFGTFFLNTREDSF